MLSLFLGSTTAIMLVASLGILIVVGICSGRRRHKFHSRASSMPGNSMMVRESQFSMMESQQAGGMENARNNTQQYQQQGKYAGSNAAPPTGSFEQNGFHMRSNPLQSIALKKNSPDATDTGRRDADEATDGSVQGHANPLIKSMQGRGRAPVLSENMSVASAQFLDTPQQNHFVNEISRNEEFDPKKRVVSWLKL